MSTIALLVELQRLMFGIWVALKFTEKRLLEVLATLLNLEKCQVESSELELLWKLNLDTEPYTEFQTKSLSRTES